MDYCATHNQFYTEFCKYCGTPYHTISSTGSNATCTMYEPCTDGKCKNCRRGLDAHPYHPYPHFTYSGNCSGAS